MTDKHKRWERFEKAKKVFVNSKGCWQEAKLSLELEETETERKINTNLLDEFHR